MNCNLLYVMPNQSLHITERHLLGMHVAQETGVPTLNGMNAYIPEFGYPYEDLENGDDSAVALGWAIAQSQELYYKGSKSITHPIIMCALDSEKKKAYLLSSDDARYPSSPYHNKEFAITRDSSNGLVIVQNQANKPPLFHKIMNEQGAPEYIDILGYAPSKMVNLGNGLVIIIDTPREDLDGYSGHHERLINLLNNRLVRRTFYPSDRLAN